MPSGRERSLERTQVVPVPLARAFEFFADAANLEAITPPWLHFRIVTAPPQLQEGARLSYRLRLFGVPIHWRTEIIAWQPPRSFTDLQLEGPYDLWEHTHRLSPVAGGTEFHDHVRYRLPGEPLASLVSALTVEPLLDAIFDYRARQVSRLVR